MKDLDKVNQRITALEVDLAAMRVVGEPVAYLWQHGETGRTRVLMPDAVFTDDGRWGLVGPLYTHHQPAAQVERNLFDAGWKAAARFCDREDVVADGIVGEGACPQFEKSFAAAIAAQQGEDHD